MKEGIYLWKGKPINDLTKKELLDALSQSLELIFSLKKGKG